MIFFPLQIICFIYGELSIGDLTQKNSMIDDFMSYLASNFDSSAVVMLKEASLMVVAVL